MKKTNLCLAILLATGLAACGSSSDGGSTNPNDGNNSGQHDKAFNDAAKQEAKAILERAKAKQKATEAAAAAFGAKAKETGAEEDEKAAKEAAKKAESAQKSVAEINAKIEAAKVAKTGEEVNRLLGEAKALLVALEGVVVDKVTDETDATENPWLAYLGKVNYDKNTSTASYQYVFTGSTNASTYDVANNPERLKAAANVMAQKTFANDLMTNAVIAQEIKENADKDDQLVLRYVGESTVQVNGAVRDHSLQAMNVKNVVVNGANAKSTDLGVNTGASTKVIDTQLKSENISDPTEYKSSGYRVDNVAYEAKGRGALKVENGLIYKGTGTSGKIVGLEKNMNTTTRVLGRNYSTSEIKTVNVPSTVDNSYKTAVSYASGAKYDLKGETLKLDHVQYGRITANLDPMRKLGKINDDTAAIEAFFLPRKDPKAVSNYFYRGTGETTIKQMKALKKDKVFRYMGHAVTYNLSHKGKGTGYENSFGKEARMMGSFVKAKFDTGSKIVEGKVYDVILPDNNAADTIDLDLVTFKGKAKGNTFFGTSKNLARDEKGALRGSFYGSTAAEMGGAINSVTKGHSNTAWGAVFGAQRTSVGSNTQSLED